MTHLKKSFLQAKKNCENVVMLIKNVDRKFLLFRKFTRDPEQLIGKFNFI